jgi:hypothetical protein
MWQGVFLIMAVSKDDDKLECVKKGARLLRGSIGSMCRGYLDGYFDLEPKTEKEADVEKYESGYFEGMSKRLKENR